MALMLETIKKQMAHDFDTYEYAPFIRIEEGAVKGGHGSLLRRFYSQKEEKPRDFLAVC
jgi:deoxyxylulose-5-phosphate synthase